MNNIWLTIQGNSGLGWLLITTSRGGNYSSNNWNPPSYQGRLLMRNISGRLSLNNRENLSVKTTRLIQPIRLEIQLGLLRSFTRNGPRTFEAGRDGYLFADDENTKYFEQNKYFRCELGAEPDLIMFVVLRGSLFH